MQNPPVSRPLVPIRLVARSTLAAWARWFPTVATFLSGQGAAQVLSLLTALSLVRILSIQEYGLYVLANVLITVGSVGSDLGLSSAFTTLGSRLGGDRDRLSKLYATVRNLRRQLFAVVSLVVLALAIYLTRGHGWYPASIIGCLFVIPANNWIQQTIGLRTSALNIHHDSVGLVRSNLIAGSVRLIATIAFCSLLPFAAIALLVNLGANVVADQILRLRSKRYLDEAAREDAENLPALRAYVYPLVARTVYFIFQGSTSVLLISYFGSSRAIAEVGALLRFNQVLAVMNLLNGFLFQPVFAKAPDRRSFLRKLGFASFALMLIFAFLLLTTFIVPQWWLALLGSKYRHLTAEVPLAVGGGILEYIGEFLFVLLLARAFTRGQYWYIGLTLLTQIVFVMVVGVDTTRQALVFNIANRGAVVLAQFGLLLLLLRNWDRAHEAVPKSSQ